ncbi:unnamed protein product [Mytilus edulis]|uniref:TRPM SLOG domain-containing protein n=1 Tax=Mytilus edulis TaxID=6550 RepID=A0A8S3S2Q1_MYTED|nr:unnamed protein product [Mytilus edulis]
MDTEKNTRSHISRKNKVIIDRWLNHSSKQHDTKRKPEEKSKEISRKYKYTRGGETQNNLKHGIIRLNSEDTEEQIKIPCIIAPADTDCLWLITGATNTGITTSVGEAIQEYRDKHENKDHIPAFGFSEWGKVVKGYYQTCNGKDLEPNHTHLIMVDGSEEKVLKLRTDLRCYLATRMQIPVILLIVEGGPKTFEIALESVRKNIPVLVIEGSGKAADFISKGYKLSEDKTSEGNSVFTETFGPEMFQSAKNMSDTSKDDPNKYVSQLKDCLKEKRKMNRQDIAYLRESLKKKDSAVSELFKKSLVNNRVEFVTLVLKYILAPECYQQFVTDNLSLLYRERIVFFDNTASLIVYGSRKRRVVVAGQFLHEYLQSSKYISQIAINVERGNWKNDRSDLKYLDDINQAVILLFGNRQLKPIETMGTIFPFKALLFGHVSTCNLGAALYASSLAKKLAESAFAPEENMELITSFAENSKYYETLAYNVMTELYCKDKSKARQLLVKKVERYGNATIFELTEHNNLMKFIGHTACQTKLNIIWKGQIATYTSHMKVMFGAFLPFLIQSMMIQHDKEKKSTYETTNPVCIRHTQGLPNGIHNGSTKHGPEFLTEQHQSKRAENWNGIEIKGKEKKRLDLLEKDAVKSYLNSSIRLRRSRAKTISSDDGSLEDRYKHDAELSLQEQVEVVTADVGQIQNHLKEITQNIKDIKAYKQKILLVELPRGVQSGTHVPDEVTMFE